MRIYLTHCSSAKDSSLKGSGKSVTPGILYTSQHIQRFMNRCKERNVEWAIFSDLYDVWSPSVKHEWYEKNPDKVSEEEFQHLLKNFNEKLQNYDEIYFYYNPGRFHRLYKSLIEKSTLNSRIQLISHLSDIG